MFLASSLLNDDMTSTRQSALLTSDTISWYHLHHLLHLRSARRTSSGINITDCQAHSREPRPRVIRHYLGCNNDVHEIYGRQSTASVSICQSYLNGTRLGSSLQKDCLIEVWIAGTKHKRRQFPCIESSFNSANMRFASSSSSCIITSASAGMSIVASVVDLPVISNTDNHSPMLRSEGPVSTPPLLFDALVVSEAFERSIKCQFSPIVKVFHTQASLVYPSVFSTFRSI